MAQKHRLLKLPIIIQKEEGANSKIISGPSCLKGGKITAGFGSTSPPDSFIQFLNKWGLKYAKRDLSFHQNVARLALRCDWTTENLVPPSHNG